MITAAVVPAAVGQPENCATTGTIGTIDFALQLPTEAWNQRYVQTGCGGFCGYVPINDCAKPLAAGFAVAAEGTGHQNTVDASWGLDNRKAEVDFGYRSPHAMAVAAKGFIAAFNGRPPVYSYFQGCSTGGRQALSQAQRYPTDFNGIVAGAPALYQNYQALLSQGHLETVNRDAAGRVILPSTKTPPIHSSVLAQCDGRTGTDRTVDGVLDDPEACDFDPVRLQCPDDVDGPDCLTSAQVTVVRAFFSPPVDSRGPVNGRTVNTSTPVTGTTPAIDVTQYSPGGNPNKFLTAANRATEPGAVHCRHRLDVRHRRRTTNSSMADRVHARQRD